MNDAIPLVSIVIPAYNAESFIEEAMNSVILQNYRPLEIIVVNDGSSDLTGGVVDNVATRNKAFAIKLIDLKENQGAANALSLGFSQAQGDYICWLSADDVYIDRNKIKQQVEIMKQKNAYWSYYRDYYQGPSVSEADLTISSYIPHLRVADWFFSSNHNRMLTMLLFRNIVNGSSIMIRRSAYENFGSFDPILKNIDPDGDLWMRYCVLKLNVTAIHGAPVFYREHKKQTSKNIFAMVYGAELARMRILKSLQNSNTLIKIANNFLTLLPILMKMRSHIERPMTTQFLCNYVSENHISHLFSCYVKKAMQEAKDRANSLKIDNELFFNDLDKIYESPVFKEFKKLSTSL